MAKHRMWVLTALDVRNVITGQQGDSALVHSKADLDRRVAAAKKAGVRVKVREVQESER